MDEDDKVVCNYMWTLTCDQSFLSDEEIADEEGDAPPPDNVK